MGGDSWAAATATVAIESGKLQGVAANGVVSYKGIPYAAPPVGNLRWRKPQPAPAWRGVRRAEHYGHDCMQQPFDGDAAPLGTTPAEDCLVLNVWRPLAASARPLPVMVWIHGGGFVNGGASPSTYAGDAFARQDVIFVSFNYRLGRFGFFGFPALSKADADHGLLGNYGYMDQIAALQWVQKNVAAFGGDPANVTLFGESAGGGSVHMLTTSPMAKGLFARAIIQSGGGRDNLMGKRDLRHDQPELPSSETLGLVLARKHGITGTGPAALARLRALPAQALTNGLNMATMWEADDYGGPMIDGRIVRTSPQEACLAGSQARIPLMIGANSADIGFGDARSKDEAFAAFGDHATAARAAYDPDGSADLASLNMVIGADRMMVEPARFVAATVSKQGLPVYAYRFSYVADSMRTQWPTGAPHATEIPYVMNTVTAKYAGALTDRDADVASQVNRYWANFAKTGNPNAAGLPEWPRYDAHQDTLMNFDADGVPKAQPDAWKVRLDLTAATQ
ncbi:carboxylesterase family protein [Duganella sp. LX47W]|uniref:Carboxylic ester hydrolase n=2 Tax=Rugamonas apoptosis TaxID=2758570 RepID=A0A7W2IK47_9BURK|nr:carboxylesterase family protein [Rugamonas apoptosis]